MNTNTEGYTPEKIVRENLFFEIPLYQRLFEWQEVQIKQLMSDLYSEYSKKEEAGPYYIGMLTSKVNSNGRFDLIDGQQRMTVLMLMGIVFQWDSFLSADREVRLSFFARPKDKSYLESRISGISSDYENVNMKRGIECMESFIKEKKMLTDQEKKSFGGYIYKNLTLFIYDLPKEYDQTDLNRYFESMNSTGRSLENHEILKVSLLKKLPNEVNKNQYTRIWNAVAEMDKPLLRQRTWKIGEKIESREEFQTRCKKTIKQALNNEPSVFFAKKQGYSLINDFYAENTSKNDSESTSRIIDIVASDTPPNKSRFSRDNRAFLSFPEFLLEVLYLTLNKTEESDKYNIKTEESDKYNITDFFNIHKLQETFNFYAKQIKPDIFIKNLLIYRLLFDIYCIKINNDDSGYSLEDYIDSETDESANQKKVIQYQSMLYVSSTTLSYYLWVAPLLKHLLDEIGRDHWLNAGEMLKYLKDKDNQRNEHDICSLKPASLAYGTVDRYWFWRLDYYLWENREQHFKGEARMVADNYVFRANRSIEHVAPQTPQHDSKFKWDENEKDDKSCRDCFGNLAMISSSQNSSLRNASYEVKQAYIGSFIRESKTGSVECLKLLKIFNDYDKWDKDKIKDHEKKMFEILKKSYPNNNFSEINNL